MACEFPCPFIEVVSFDLVTVCSPMCLGGAHTLPDQGCSAGRVYPVGPGLSACDSRSAQRSEVGVPVLRGSNLSHSIQPVGCGPGIPAQACDGTVHQECQKQSVQLSQVTSTHYQWGRGRSEVPEFQICNDSFLIGISVSEVFM